MNDPSNSSDSWEAYQKLVLEKLDTLESGQSRLSDDVSSLRTEVAVLKVKSGIWGAAAGAIPVAVAWIWQSITEHKR